MININSITTRRNLAKWASSKPLVRCLVVFGSYAKGTAKPDSDIDIAVVVSETGDASERLLEWMDNKPRWRNELCVLLGFERVQLEKLCVEHSHVMRYVREAHIVVYDPDNVIGQLL
jgi:predicted nucleotidyltransferase